MLRIIRFIKLWKNKLGKDNSAILCDGLNFTLLLSCFLCKIFLCKIIEDKKLKIEQNLLKDVLNHYLEIVYNITN